MVRGPIAFIFGTIIVLNMLQNSLFAKAAQPVRSALNAVTAIVIGAAPWADLYFVWDSSSRISLAAWNAAFAAGTPQ
jgi:hypothetical protein